MSCLRFRDGPAVLCSCTVSRTVKLPTFFKFGALAIDDDDSSDHDDTLPMTIRIVALVGDCYGAPGGIARYNQDLFEALVAAEQPVPSAQDAPVEILVVPRLGNASGLTLPAGIRQWPPVFSRMLYSLVSFWVAWRHRPIDIVFCGHVYMAPLAWGLARFFGARYWLQTHGVDIWMPRGGIKRAAVEKADLVTAVSRITRRRLLGWADLDPHRVRVLPNTVRDIFARAPHQLPIANGWACAVVRCC